MATAFDDLKFSFEQLGQMDPSDFANYGPGILQQLQRQLDQLKPAVNALENAGGGGFSLTADTASITVGDTVTYTAAGLDPNQKIMVRTYDTFGLSEVFWAGGGRPWTCTTGTHLYPDPVTAPDEVRGHVIFQADANGALVVELDSTNVMFGDTEYITIWTPLGASGYPVGLPVFAAAAV